MVRLSVVGVSGYSGMELVRLIAAHPELGLAAAIADRWHGDALGAHLRGLDATEAALVVAPMRDAVAAASDADIALLATPAEVSARLAPELVAKGVRVVDLSGAFRLPDRDAYPRHYGFEHPAPDLLAEARYGLPEIPETAGSAPAYARARLVANPGCYATAAIVALVPLVAAKLIEPSAIFVDGKSGVTGAGRKTEERLMFTEVAENVSPYRIGSHQHVPEMELALSRVAGAVVRITFAPHLLPVRRGLIVTAFGRLTDAAAETDVAETMRAFYARPSASGGEIDAVAPEAVTLAAVAHTSRAVVGARCDRERGSVIALGALDNLLKGAASQALQNVCAMTGVRYRPGSS